MIHGPPGTGKTTVLIEIIKQLLDGKKNVLVCAHSNQAVDNILSRLFDLFEKDHDQFPYFGVIDENESTVKETVYKRGSHRVHRDRNVIKNFDFYNTNMVQNNTRLVFSTLHGISDRNQPKRSKKRNGAFYVGRSEIDFKPDVTIIDEAGQTLDVDAWGAMIGVPKCIFAGDHHQLPPVVVKQGSASKFVRFECKSLMQRIVDDMPESELILLNCQHRMNQQIFKWSNKTFYKDKVGTSQSVRWHQINEMLAPVVVFDIKGLENRFSKSFTNNEESVAIANYSQFLQDVHGVNASQIGIISSYDAQNKIIAQKIRDQKYSFDPDLTATEERLVKRKKNLESEQASSGSKISTVDGFQGSEMDVILVSLVRSNNERNIGFLKDLRRLNVAATRARKHLVIFCDVKTVSKNKDIKSLVETAGERIDYEKWINKLLKTARKTAGFESLANDIDKNNAELKTKNPKHQIARNQITKNWTAKHQNSNKTKNQRKQRMKNKNTKTTDKTITCI